MNPPHPNRNYNKRPGAAFLKGPVPLSWLAAALKAGGTAPAVGLYLWHLRGLRKTMDSLVVTRKGSKTALGIGRGALARGLTRLETAGLITCTRGQGKAIRVTILNAEAAGARP